MSDEEDKKKEEEKKRRDDDADNASLWAILIAGMGS
jgi:hypothetical protein